MWWWCSVGGGWWGVVVVVLVVLVVVVVVVVAPRSTLDTTCNPALPTIAPSLPMSCDARMASTTWSTFMLTRWVVVGE